MRLSGQKCSRRENGAGGNRQRRHISFSCDENKVCFVKPPPRSMNHHYWFTETESVVKKALSFEIEPHINVSVDVGCRMQLTSVASKPSNSTIFASNKGDTKGKGLKNSGSSDRVFLEIKADTGLRSLGGHRTASRWITTASVEEGHVEKVRIILPPGTYTLRCIGGRPMQIFAQAWDLETKLG